MPLHAAEALILRTYKLGEADRIVVFLTADRGKRRGVAKGARKPRSRFAGGLEPLTRGRVEYFERERRELVRLLEEPALLQAGREAEPQRRRLAELRGERECLQRVGARLLTAYQEELIDLDELRSRGPAIHSRKRVL
jgi:DNA repair protein RecO (recombination protein O)